MDKALSAPLHDAAAPPAGDTWAALRLTPDQHPLPSLAALLRAQAWSSPGWVLAGSLPAAAGLATGQALGVWVGGLLAAWPLLQTAWAHPSHLRHRRLLRHHALGDWERVRVLARSLRRRAARHPELGFDVDLCLAGIYARDHNLPDALARLAPWRVRLNTRPGAFDAALAELRLMAGDTVGHVAALARAQRQAPQDAGRRVDLALAEARFGEIDRAEQWLRDTPLVPPQHQAQFAWAQGLMELRRDRPEAAATLGRAVALLAEQAVLREAWVPLAHGACDHAIALLQAGQRQAARARIAAVWPVLEHHAPVPVLRMLEADALLPTRIPPNT